MIVWFFLDENSSTSIITC